MPNFMPFNPSMFRGPIQRPGLGNPPMRRPMPPSPLGESIGMPPSLEMGGGNMPYGSMPPPLDMGGMKQLPFGGMTPEPNMPPPPSPSDMGGMRPGPGMQRPMPGMQRPMPGGGMQRPGRGIRPRPRGPGMSF